MNTWRRSTRRSPRGRATRSAAGSRTWTCCWWTTCSSSRTARRCNPSCCGSRRRSGAGHQIVLTSDRPPAEIADLDERLISRLSGGLVVDMGVPDYETRVPILRRKAEERGASFQPGVLEAVAKVEYPNVRELMGALNRLVAFQAVNDMPINAEAASKVLG